MLQYWGLLLFSLLAPLVPPGLAYRLCQVVGDLIYRLSSQRREIVRRNLATVLADRPPDLETRVREVFRQSIITYYDTFRIPGLTDDTLRRLISLEGGENVDLALQRGKGAIVFTAHLGSPSLVSQMLALRWERVTVVVEPIRPEKLFDLMVRVRSGRGIRMVPFGPASTRELTEALRRNDLVGLVVDRDLPGTGVTVDFFGAGARLPAGPALLALRTGAALIPAFAYRRPGDSFVGNIGEPLNLERTGDLREDIRVNTQKVAEALEKGIAKCPEQWTVFEPIWTEEPEAASRGVAS